MNILLDMDDVLVDCAGGICQLHHVRPSAVYDHAKGLPWSRALWHGISCETSVPPDMVRQETLHLIRRGGASFWEHLPGFDWSVPVWQLCRETGRVVVCTDPSWDSREAIRGKVDWIHRRLCFTQDEFIFTTDKARYANGTQTVLVDDRPENVQAFREAGGRAFLFPMFSEPRDTAVILDDLRSFLEG